MESLLVKIDEHTNILLYKQEINKELETKNKNTFDNLSLDISLKNKNISKIIEIKDKIETITGESPASMRLSKNILFPNGSTIYTTNHETDAT